MLDLITQRPLIWGLFASYMAITSVLAWIGHRRTKDLSSFAVGGRQMSPIIVGITLAASIASTATFVINPGFVYVHGVSALLHLGVAAGLGVIVGLFTISFGFRRFGAANNALTLPQWLGQRYASRAMTIFFAGVNLLSITFVVLIVGGLSIVMQKTLGLSNLASVGLTILFVFGYVFAGGTYAHAFTNTVQGGIMAVIAVVIVASGLPHLTDLSAVSQTLAAVDPNLVGAINPESSLFNSFFSVFVSGFVIGFALVCQPHIMVKALYVKDDKAVWQYLFVCIGVSLTFTALLLVGIYAHMLGLPAEKFVDPATGVFRQDLVMTVYVFESFSPTMLATVTVALLAAGMSTLDGILVALSAIAANDIFLNLFGNRIDSADEGRRLRIAHRAGQIILVGMGIITFVIALNPPRLLGIFGQIGVYGIGAASCAPILFGVLTRVRGRIMLVSAVMGLLIHLGLYLWGMTDPTLGFANPAVTATWGIIVSTAIATLGWFWTQGDLEDSLATGLQE
jgi:SSS family solute:Na+ symporter/sodium/pantothenate symporter